MRHSWLTIFWRDMVEPWLNQLVYTVPSAAGHGIAHRHALVIFCQGQFFDLLIVRITHS